MSSVFYYQISFFCYLVFDFFWVYQTVNSCLEKAQQTKLQEKKVFSFKQEEEEEDVSRDDEQKPAA